MARRFPHLSGCNAGLAAGFLCGAVGGLSPGWTTAVAAASALVGAVGFAAATLAGRGLGTSAALATAVEGAGWLPLAPSIAAVATVSWLTAATAVWAVPLALVAGTAVSLLGMRVLHRRGREPVAAAEIDSVRYRGEVVAVAGPERVWFMPQIEVLERDHPRRRFVAALCLIECHRRAGVLPAGGDGDLERLARELLIPAETLGDDSDAAAAERLNVPLEQVAARRRDLGRAPARR